MDEFEKHIKNNRSEFDEFSADSSKMWQAISAELDQPVARVLPLWRTTAFKVAAGFLIILGFLGVVNLSLGIDPKADESLALQELQEIDRYYQGMVLTQVKLVENNNNLSAGDKEEFLVFMDELDAEYEQLKLDLNDNLDNEKVLSAIVSNYKKRIELIENLLKQINNAKENTDEEAYIL